MDSFIEVTGAKGDLYLAKMVAFLTLSVGVALIWAALADMIKRGIMLLALLSAHAFMVLDLSHPDRGWLSNERNLDLIANASILTLWLIAGFGDRAAFKKAGP